MLRQIIHTRSLLLFAIILGIAGIAPAQSPETKENESGKTQSPAASNPKTVNAVQSGPWTVGLDQAKNTVRIANTEAEPVPVKIMPTSNGRKAFQARLIVAPQGEGFASALMQIPAGKRLIIENISAVGRTPEGFIGQMFKVTGKHVPPPASMPSPILWGVEEVVKERFGDGVTKVELVRRPMRFDFPFGPADTVEFFRKYYGPTQKAFDALDAEGQSALRTDLEYLWLENNEAKDGSTVVMSEYLDVRIIRS